MRYKIDDQAKLSKVKQVATIEAMLFDDAWDEKSIRDLLKQSMNNVSLMLIDDKVVGYCLYQKLFETAEILRIATHPQFQRQGLGYILLEHWLSLMQKQAVTSVLLEVNVDNAAALTLYERIGFQHIDTRKGYYHNKLQGTTTDAWIMQYHIDSGEK